MKPSDCGFFQKLKDKRSISLQESLSNFVNADFKKISGGDKSDISRHVQEFITKMVNDFAQTWSLNLLSNQKLYAEICDGFENILTKSLYNKIFCSTRKEKEDDYNFEKAVRKYSFVQPKHLDIDESLIDVVYIEVAINKLSMINQYKPPKDKGVVLLNFCNILTSMITTQASRTNKKIAGADEVFPLVVYCIIKGNIRKIKSNLVYIYQFRHETRLESQEEYYFTTINSAIEFIENLSYNKLNIREEEYEEYLEEAENEELERLSVHTLHSKRNPDETSLLYQLTSEKRIYESSNPIELSDLNHSVLINTESTVNKTLLSRQKENGVFNINLQKLYKEYFQDAELKEFPLSKLERLYNDFRIVLRLVELHKKQLGKSAPQITKSQHKNQSEQMSTLHG